MAEMTNSERISDPDFASPQFKANPYPFYARLRNEAPVYRVKLAFWLPEIWIVTRYDDVIAMLKDERLSKDFYEKFPWLPGFVRKAYRNLLTLDPPDHTRLRSLVQKAFTPQLIERLRERIQSVCDDLLREAATNSRMEIVGQYASPLPLTVIADLLGIPPQDRSRFGPWARRVATAIASADFTDQLRSFPSVLFFTRYLRHLVRQRRNRPQDDLVTALVRAEEEGDRLSEEEIVSMLGLLLIAGYETTVHLISSGMLTLLHHPEQRLRLQEHPEFIKSAVEELLRYTSPVEFSMPRLTREDITIGSSTIPRHRLVAAGLGSANHDEAQFSDPESFDITRDPNRHVAFGVGPHFCLGASLARLEIQIAFTTLLRRFPNLRLTEPAEDSVRWRRSVALRGLDRLSVDCD